MIHYLNTTTIELLTALWFSVFTMMFFIELKTFFRSKIKSYLICSIIWLTLDIVIIYYILNNISV